LRDGNAKYLDRRSAAGDVARAGVLADQKLGRVGIEPGHRRGQHDVAVIVGGVAPEIPQFADEPSANGVGVRSVGRTAADHARTNLDRRQKVLRAEHDAVPVGWNTLHEPHGCAGKSRRRDGVIFEHEQGLDPVAQRAIDNRKVREQAAPGPSRAGERCLALPGISARSLRQVDFQILMRASQSIH
jgi:hypothetical protein